MAYQCYYCDHQTESVHYVTFYEPEREHSELLCDECYSEWLESIKG
ncbi:hypothetical protein [Brevibacillus massiliensis]|jgi:hypothetical protein|nr:hypothetical protein [Brevibacillus massiliensis]